MLIQYVRTKDRRPVGVVVAVGKNAIGWSKLNKLDSWDREKGLSIASGRAMKYSVKEVEKNAPHDVKPIIESMKKRAKNYYK